MKAKDLRERGTDDLQQLDKQLSGDLFQYRMKNFTNRLDDASLIHKTKRDIARVRMILAERERAAKNEAR